jgi:hypothetical protein
MWSAIWLSVGAILIAGGLLVWGACAEICKMKNLFLIFAFLPFLAFAQDDLTPIPVKPIDYAKFEDATSTASIAVEGKVISTSGVISTVSVATDHAIESKAGKASVTGGNGAGQKNAPSDTFVSVVSGYSHCVGLTAAGKVVCWGYAAHGQCDVPKYLGFATAIAAGHSHTLALVGGRVFAWGDNHEHQCDVLEGLPTIVSIDASGDYSMATDAAGTVYVWGNGEQPRKYQKLK